MNKKSKWRIFRHNLKVIYKKHKLRNNLILFSITLIVLFSVSLIIYQKNLQPVLKYADNMSFTIEPGDTYNSIAPVLKENNLIKSTLAYKIYVKLHNPQKLEVGIYSLNPSWNVKRIVNTLKKGTKYQENAVVLTIPEGVRLKQIASKIADSTNNSVDDVINSWQNEEFINEVINKYWFVTDEVKNPEIKYALEGYLFADTYYFKNKDVTPQEIAYKMLDQMDNVLTEYKSSIDASPYTVHQILTLASIIELEGSSENDRAGVAGVFYNRLNNGSSLGSDVTTYYAVDKSFGEELTMSDLQTCSKYNTSSNNSCLIGLPIGPIDSPSTGSIVASINPTNHEYLYFVADKNKKTYFSKTYEEHNQTITTLKEQNLWYEY